MDERTALTLGDGKSRLRIGLNLERPYTFEAVTGVANL